MFAYIKDFQYLCKKINIYTMLQRKFAKFLEACLSESQNKNMLSMV